MKIGKISVVGIQYDVIKRKMTLKDAEGESVMPWGTCDPTNTLIVLNEKSSRERTFVCFIHECLHALLHESVSQQYIKPGKLEDFIENFEAPLAAFVRDNLPLIRKMGRF